MCLRPCNRRKHESVPIHLRTAVRDTPMHACRPNNCAAESRAYLCSAFELADLVGHSTAAKDGHR
jgi:hypothetical protein